MTEPGRVIGLWAVPRSVSTAFERIMRERGDLDCFHEPFLGFYYYSEERSHERFAADNPPDPSQLPEAVRARLFEAAEERPVFFKDLAYYLSRRMGPEVIEGIESTFLVRHPTLSLASLYRLQPDTTWEETGFERLLELMRLVRERSGRPLVVVDAEELKRDPEAAYRAYCDRVGLPYVAEALEWEQGPPSGEWKPWERWHREAMESTAIEPPTEEQQAAVDVSVPPDGVPAGVHARCLEIWDQINVLACEHERG